MRMRMQSWLKCLLARSALRALRISRSRSSSRMYHLVVLPIERPAVAALGEAVLEHVLGHLDRDDTDARMPAVGGSEADETTSPLGCRPAQE